MKAILTILLLLEAAIKLAAQVSCFAEVSLDRHNVYVQQPFRVTITVLTATWYTAPLEFDNIQLPNAFVLPFDQTTPGMFDVRGRQYAGLQFYFIVFPYKPGTFQFPSIAITAQTPAEGDSRSQTAHIKTTPQHFTVKPVPAEEQNDRWFVAKNVFVSEHWSKPLKDLLVGDVIERTVSISAKGTLPQFIPQLQKDSLDFASTYMQNAQLQDERNDYDANGRLTQSVIYLLEKEGNFVIPAIGVSWWNPNSNRLYSRSAAAEKIQVKPNAHLGMLATLKDSLTTHQAAIPPAPVHKKQWKIFGIDWYWGLLIILTGSLLLYRLSRLLIYLWNKYKLRHARYLAGEPYAFRRWMKSSSSLQSFIKAMYLWWDSLPGQKSSLSILHQWQRHGPPPPIETELSGYLQQSYGLEKSELQVAPSFKKEIKAYRIKIIQDSLSPKDGRVSVYQSAYSLHRP